MFSSSGLLVLCAFFLATAARGLEQSPIGPIFQKTSSSVRIVAWNIEWFPGQKPDADKAAQAKHIKQVQSALRSIKPDILLVEEVRDPEAVRKAISVLPGMDVHIVSRFKEGNELGKQQTGISSRFKADSAFFEEWKQGAHHPPRGFSFAALELPKGVVLLTYAVHLKSNRGSGPEMAENIAKREESAAQLVSHVAEMEKNYAAKGRKTAVLIGGDFNLLETPEFAREKTRQTLIAAGLSWAWEGVPFNRRITWPPRGEFGGACFDHFYTKGLGAIKATALKLDEASDHRPIELTLTVK